MQPEKQSMSMRPKFTSVRGAGRGNRISWKKKKLAAFTVEVVSLLGVDVG